MKPASLKPGKETSFQILSDNRLLSDPFVRTLVDRSRNRGEGMDFRCAPFACSSSNNLHPHPRPLQPKSEWIIVRNRNYHGKGRFIRPSSSNQTVVPLRTGSKVIRRLARPDFWKREKWINGWGDMVYTCCGNLWTRAFLHLVSQPDGIRWISDGNAGHSFLNTPRRWPFHARQVRDSERLCTWRRLVITALCVCVLLCTYGNSVTVLIIPRILIFWIVK